MKNRFTLLLSIALLLQHCLPVTARESRAYSLELGFFDHTTVAATLQFTRLADLAWWDFSFTKTGMHIRAHVKVAHGQLALTDFEQLAKRYDRICWTGTLNRGSLAFSLNCVFTSDQGIYVASWPTVHAQVQILATLRESLRVLPLSERERLLEHLRASGPNYAGWAELVRKL
jgi:hypothetical protein